MKPILRRENRGWVRGLSMWPNLVPGDLLASEDLPAESLRVGDVAVFPGSAGLLVHRVLEITAVEGGVRIRTGGDRSGPDDDVRFFVTGFTLKRVTGVLRRGRYRRIACLRLPQWLFPPILVRIHCKIVRSFFWG